jgi:hypothetical protein
MNSYRRQKTHFLPLKLQRIANLRPLLHQTIELQWLFEVTLPNLSCWIQCIIIEVRRPKFD